MIFSRTFLNHTRHIEHLIHPTLSRLNESTFDGLRCNNKTESTSPVFKFEFLDNFVVVVLFIFVEKLNVKGNHTHVMQNNGNDENNEN